MTAGLDLLRSPKPPRPCALKSASTEIFRKSRASQGRSAAYRFGAYREFAYAYGKPRQDRQSLQTDPVGYEGDLNLYLFTRNDPLNNIDPNGRDVVALTRPIGFGARHQAFIVGSNESHRWEYRSLNGADGPFPNHAPNTRHTYFDPWRARSRTKVCGVTTATFG
jgi:hypothetical protein